MSDSEDRIRIPAAWEEARTYLESALEERRTRLDRRDDAVEARIKHIETAQAAMASELHDVRNGITGLFAVMADANERHDRLIAFNDQTLQVYRESIDRARVEQEKQGKTLASAHRILNREDKYRSLWRGLIVGLTTLAIIVSFTLISYLERFFDSLPMLAP